jgi:hypothetical protein
MNAAIVARPSRERPVTLVWIDSREALIAGWHEGAASITRIASDVPPHRRGLGHTPHDPNVRHGEGIAESAGESRRLEHLGRFVATVAEQLPPADDLLVLGPGTVHERLARHIRDLDEHHRVGRDIVCESAPRMTRRQLLARLRRAMGDEPRRKTVGAYRWSRRPNQPSTEAPAGPWRVGEKGSHHIADGPED